MDIFTAISEAISKVEWSFESHDPMWAWCIVGMYSVSALLCLRALFGVQRSLFPDSIKKKSRIFWSFLFVIMLFLACNKQLDIQTYLTAVGREVANSQGWYDQRRNVQKEFIIVLGLVAFLFLVYLAYVVYTLPNANKIALVGALCTFTFIGMRAASFHHLDQVVGTKILGVKIHILVEICGGTIVIIGALLSYRGISKWELYYDSHPLSGETGGLLNRDFDLDSDVEFNSVDEEGQNGFETTIEYRTGKKVSPHGPSTDIGVSDSLLVDAYVCDVEGNLNSGDTNVSASSSLPPVEGKNNLSLSELVSGRSSQADSGAEPVDLFQKVSNPNYASKKKPKIDNSSPRVSREKLSEVNRLRRISDPEQLNRDAAVGNPKYKKGREDNWLTRNDETGWI